MEGGEEAGVRRVIGAVSGDGLRGVAADGLGLSPQIWVDEAPHPALRFAIRMRTHPESIQDRGKGIRQRVGSVHRNTRSEILGVAHWPLARVFV